MANIEAGNLYINRGTTGALVLRQPFGGRKKSALGARLKAGGPNYLSQFMTFEETGFPDTPRYVNDHPLLEFTRVWKQELKKGRFTPFADELNKTIEAARSYLYHAEDLFWQERDYFHLRGQDNILRYQPIGRLIIRLHEEDSLFEVLARIAAAKITGCQTIISIPPGLNNPVISFLKSKSCKKLKEGARISRHHDQGLIMLISTVDRIRYASPERVPPELYDAAAKLGFYISRTKVMMEGRIELLQYVQEQSICTNYHRYGNLGERALSGIGPKIKKA